jgi:hypothetical protein
VAWFAGFEVSCEESSKLMTWTAPLGMGSTLAVIPGRADRKPEREVPIVSMLDLSRPPAQGQSGQPTVVRPHPLKKLALDEIRRVENLTTEELGRLLGGDATHHRQLAFEILDVLEARGIVWRNDAGQYRAFWPYPGHPPEAYLTVQLAARSNCRYGLSGLRVWHLDRARVIRSTAWNADSELIVYFEHDEGEPPVLADDLVLLDKWPVVCCRPSRVLLKKATLARRADKS